MADWPNDRYHKPVLSTFSAESVGTTIACSAGVPNNAVWPTANAAVYVPFALGGNYLVRKVFWCNGGTVAGNIDAGVYSWDGTRLFSSGSTAQATINITQSVDITDYLLTPGSYYMAFACSSATATTFGATIGGSFVVMAGVAAQATALPLPATATFASTTAVSVRIPLFGITSGTIL